MPISVKTMRDIWDEEKPRKKLEKKAREREGILPPVPVLKEYLDYLKVKEKSLAEIRKQRLDFLEREKWSKEIFDFIERDLGEAGFSRIH